jgi:hypothetical protein
MAIAVTGRRVIKDASGTNIVFEFSNGSALEFPSVAAALASCAELEATPDLARVLLIARFLAQQPDAGNVNLFEGKTLTLNMADVVPIKVQ